ncbi:alpha-L-fucosidase [Joostella atrarenae]|uniref:alpha-L-fucosidase n=1 Tax=Joostella atrarenae TaxID=679257 RepID=A0ABS9J2P4_9FLAO|nr:alpha-L-fucosidase [Joostella atrarenae]MCF8714716.1 alpha-L-fucosidase [Joostella atrarenae]
MKSKLILIALCFFNVLSSQNKDWKDIDKREFPQWWKDAKFGIFIHWGPYSVPAFSKVGEYSEWYWKDLKDSTTTSHKELKAFHDKNYGESFAYPDFVPKFKAELFDADQWASMLEGSGAKYVVLTSKHHDGYTLWPNKEANESWGRPWNSTNSGPMKDLVGELTEAVRKTDVKMGLYYSLYEWFNPLYNTDIDLFAEKHLVPQFKDVVTKYKPAVIFADGEWEHPYNKWKSTEMLTWLFNESPVKDEVVINDRWGEDTRHKHGGYYTTEYGSGLPNSTHPWEENRGMAHSFGFSRTENLSNYNTSQEFVYMLIDIVSRGGNFLLDIGPTADGRIPVIMQERLKDIGDWMDVNGEAIYETTAYNKSCQWSEGEIRDSKRGRYKVPYDIMKLTVNPEKGFAVKEVFFTQKGNVLYCISPKLPDGKLLIKDVKVKDNANITMLGIKEKLNWKKTKTGIEIDMPKFDYNNLPCKHAYSFKIEGVK